MVASSEGRRRMAVASEREARAWQENLTASAASGSRPRCAERQWKGVAGSRDACSVGDSTAVSE